MTGIVTCSAADRLARAANEFGCNVSFAGDDGDKIERLYIQALIDAVARKGHRSDFGPRTIGILLRRMPQDHADVDHLISLIDDDDGWPACKVLNAIKGLHCALANREASSRWLAEAAIQIGELYTSGEQDGFRDSAKTWAGNLLTVTVAQVVHA